MTDLIKIGTRGSPLALVQAGEVRARLVVAHAGLGEGDIELVVIKTSGDTIQDRRLFEQGGKGLFTKEIEEALIAGEIDLAVHSAKDMPASLPDGLVLSTFLEREDPRDAFISTVAATLEDLPEGAKTGTSSLRRQAQALALRPDLEIVPLRGNVETRIKKLEAGEMAATFLAAAGLHRLGLAEVITSYLDWRTFVPAPGQGAICLEVREDDEKTRELVAPLNHAPTMHAVTVERAVSTALGASCRMPLAAFAQIRNNKLQAVAALFSPDGKRVWRAGGEAEVGKAEELGRRLGETILAKADPDLIREFMA